MLGYLRPLRGTRLRLGSGRSSSMRIGHHRGSGCVRKGANSYRGPERFPGRLELGIRHLDPRAIRHRAHHPGSPVGRRDGDAVTHSRRVSSSRNTGTSSDGHPVPPPRRWKVRETTSLSTGASGSAGASSHSVQPYQARTLRPSTVVCFATGRGMTARNRRGNSARWLPPATSWWWPAPSWPASHPARQTDWILSVSNRPAGTTRRAQRPHAPRRGPGAACARRSPDPEYGPSETESRAGVPRPPHRGG